MHLTPREVDKLIIFTTGEVARRRRARGLKLNHPEAVALITLRSSSSFVTASARHRNP